MVPTHLTEHNLHLCHLFPILFPFTYPIEKRAELKQWSWSKKKRRLNPPPRFYQDRVLNIILRPHRLPPAEGRRPRQVTDAAGSIVQRTVSAALLCSAVAPSPCLCPAGWVAVAERDFTAALKSVALVGVFFCGFTRKWEREGPTWRHNRFRQPSVWLLVSCRNVQRAETLMEDPSALQWTK